MNGSDHAILLNANTVKGAIAQDDELVMAVKAGSPGAFAELHAMYSRRLYNTIVSITKSPEDAEDALQETFLRVYRAIHTFEGRSSVYSWLTRIAINSALMVLRKRRARPEVSLDLEPDAPGAEAICSEAKDSALDPEQLYDLHQRRVKLMRAVHNLNAHLRGPIRMRMAKESSIREIGQALNISEAAVKARLRRACLRLSGAFAGGPAQRKQWSSKPRSPGTAEKSNWNPYPASR
jgi:RNA polymerase sigma-70 factor (ECF subfamily)